MENTHIAMKIRVMYSCQGLNNPTFQLIGIISKMENIAKNGDNEDGGKLLNMVYVADYLG